MERLYVFREIAPELYDVWTYRAVFIVEGVIDVSVTGSFGDGWISDAAIEQRGQVLDVKELLRERDIDVVELTMRNGGRVRIRGTRARIEFEGALEKVEQWTGALAGGGSAPAG